MKMVSKIELQNIRYDYIGIQTQYSYRLDNDRKLFGNNKEVSKFLYKHFFEKYGDDYISKHLLYVQGRRYTYYENGTTTYENIIEPYGDEKEIKIIEQMLDTEKSDHYGFIIFKDGTLGDVFKMVQALEDIGWCEGCYLNNMYSNEVYTNADGKTLLYTKFECDSVE